MHSNKKMLSVAVIALLVLSIAAAAAPAFALSAPTLDVNSGPVGTKVTVSGTDAQPFGSVTVYWDSLSGAVLGTAAVAADGSYSTQVVIPSATATSATNLHYIVVNDGTGARGTEFAVTPSVVASTTPATGDTTVQAKVLPGDSLTLTGNGFAGSTSTTTVTVAVQLDSVNLATPNTVTITSPVITTNATGSFQVTIIVPNTIAVAQYDTYTVTATDNSAAANSASTALPILIGYYVTVSPASGPVGITATISGRIPAAMPYTITISGNNVAQTQIASGTSDATGAFSNTYTIPTLLAAQQYTISVSWSVTANPVTTTFTVTAAPTVSLSVYEGVAGLVVTVTGANFVPKANMTLYFGDTVVNSTSTDSRFKASTATGTVSNTFSVPALTPGVYTVTLTDQYGASAKTTTPFTIKAAAVTVMETRAASYVQGDTISFNIYSTDTVFNSLVLTIRAPGVVFWNAVPLSTTTIGATTSVIYASQVDAVGNHFTLPADAPTGTWNWTVSFVDSIGDHTTSATNWKTGTFEVGQGGTSGIISAINALNGTLVSIKGDVATIKTSVGTTLSTDVSSIKGTVTSIQGDIATLNIPDVGAITTKLDSIDAVLGVVAGDTTTLKTSLGDVTTSLSSINTKVTSIDGNVATIQTSVGTLQGTITSVSGNVATIQTGIGTLQTDISGLQSDMSSVQSSVSSSKSATDSLSPLIIVAIVLALVAAIAAIASIVMMRRKIAG